MHKSFSAYQKDTKKPPMGGFFVTAYFIKVITKIRAAVNYYCLVA